MSRVDVVVPCFNYGRYLERCVASILDQPNVEVRVLIIDDGSTDDSGAVARRLSEEDARVEYRRHDVNRGHIATYNEGLIGWARGDYCLLISADDLLTPGALTRATAVLDRAPNVGLCYGRQIVFTNGLPEFSPGAGTPQVSVTSGRGFWEECCRTGQNIVATPTAVVRTSVQHMVGGYTKELPHTADLEMWLRIAARSAVASIDAPQAFKRMHGQNMQLQLISRALDDLRARERAFDSACRECAALLPEVSRSQRAYRRALAFEAFWAASAAFDQGRVALCEEWMATACEVDPLIVETGEWRRLALKRRLGIRVWATLHPWADRLRAKSPVSPSVPRGGD